MREVRFGTDGDSPCNIFVVHEAEAQAMHALTESLNQLEVSHRPLRHIRQTYSYGSGARPLFSSTVEEEPLILVSIVWL